MRSVVEDPEILRERQQIVQSKSVSELAAVTSLSDIPIPEGITNIFSGKAKKPEDDRPESPRSPSRGEGMYGTLPRSLKKELAVVNREEEMSNELKQNMEIVRSKSPSELGQINSFSEIPVPRTIETWLHSNESKKGLDSPARPSRSAHELRGISGEGRGIYDTLPGSLKRELKVVAKEEDQDLCRERAEITRSKTPAELAKIGGISDIPIPGLWTDKIQTEKSVARKKAEEKKKSKSQPGEEGKPGGGISGTLNRHCVVRCKVEDPEVLRKHQELQQSKSIHELSKIGNINEIPLPFNLPLPDIPLPNPANLLKIIARTPKKKEPATQPEGYSPASSPMSPDRTDDELLR